ncbi:MAG: lipoyl(octanoyl) transferase LipB [Gammaproteobacteria bacterium]|jgi:lipoyl(octanoyl) transferase|nr:lipoyl(octanoyl) transferase LipB [Gammaproteobacteria bacterium]MBT3870522.1 lipoyl(octanoyl) transferase LipB [Gammaproteobacteria bacterium]MBT4379754.1 lipoyl(octanoyl) transferase LipB [Gammaproteobacteria bacterium]MBT4615473.1 lipoyl(octanoyl) transferase LipB [Gammaproteobacteria bacterium]MBT5198323.1 lipoyl(octanoyl) transferase LipB [Gammaproteobacteria bacterium]
MGQPLVVKNLGEKPYAETWQAMKSFTDSRDECAADEFWFVQHPPVYTLGQAGKVEHLLRPGDIPIVHSDRGGQVTYHGPGQLVCYLLLDIRRLQLGVRDLVTAIEQSIVQLINSYGVAAEAKPEAPGVYVDGRKLAALGLRIRKGRSYHGLSLNVDMDLGPFSNINPCGIEGLEVVDMKRLGIDRPMAKIMEELTDILVQQIGYDGEPRLRTL